MMKHFFVGVKAVIVVDNKILLLKDSSKPDFWDMPGGRIDDNETIEQALLRELREELPLHRNAVIGKLLNVYRVPGSIEDDLGLVLLFYKVQLEFDGDITLSAEHTDYQWSTTEEALILGSDGVRTTIALLQ